MSCFFHTNYPKIKQLLVHDLIHIISCIHFSTSLPFRYNNSIAKLSISHSTPEFYFLKPIDMFSRNTVFIILFFWISPYPNFIFICPCLHLHFICPYNSPPFLNSPVNIFFCKVQSCYLLLV